MRYLAVLFSGSSTMNLDVRFSNPNGPTLVEIREVERRMNEETGRTCILTNLIPLTGEEKS